MNFFILESALGDALLTTGIIDKLKDEPSIIAATSRSIEMFRDLPNLHKLFSLARKPFKKQYFDIWREVKRHPLNHLIDLRRTGFRYILKANHKFTRSIFHTGESLIPRVLQFSEDMGSKEPLHPTIWISNERLSRVQGLLQGRPIFSVSPIAHWIGKQWPMEHFCRLLSTFCKTYPEAQIAVFAAPHEEKHMEPLLNIIPQDQIIKTFGWHLLDIAALIKSSCLFIGNDSGLMHMSAAVNTPTLALFGPSYEGASGPWFSGEGTSPHRVLRDKPFSVHMSQVDGDQNCYMTSLLVEPVWEVVQEMWKKYAPQPQGLMNSNR